MYTQGISIDGINYNIPIVSIGIEYSFLEKYAQRTEDGDIKIETIGGYQNYNVTLGTLDDATTFKKIYAQLTDPNNRFHTIRIPGDTGYDDFYGYVSSISAKVDKILSNKVKYSDFSFKMTAKKPTRR